MKGSVINLILGCTITKDKHPVKVLEGFLFDQRKSELKAIIKPNFSLIYT